MTVQSRPTPLHQPITNFGDLQDWIDRRLEGIEEDLADDETAQANGRALRERRATLLDVAHAIREAVASEASVDAQESAEEAWREHVLEVAAATLFPRADSWYVGANVPGKPREMLNYPGGLPQYLQRWKDCAAEGYSGFAID